MNTIIEYYKPIETNIINDISNINIINQYVENIYIINLNTDKLREQYIKILMKKLNINYTLIRVEKPNYTQYNRVLLLSKPGSKKMTVGEVGCYLSHMWCLNSVIKKNYKNVIIFEDDIIVHKDFHSLFEKIVINGKNQIEYDFLMLGAADHGFNRGNSELIRGNIYIPKNHVTMATHAIYYSNYGAKKIYYYRLKYPVYFDKHFKELFTFFKEDKTGICYPNLFTVENSTSNMVGHNFGIVRYKYNDYYYNACYKNFDFNDYHFIYLDLFTKYMLEPREKTQNFSIYELIKALLMNYFNDDEELADFHYSKLDIDFFTMEEYNELLEIAKNPYTQLYYKEYKEYCERKGITSGQLIKDKPTRDTMLDIDDVPQSIQSNLLFHKQYLDISLQNKNISYEIVNQIPFTKKYIAHLHCFDIDKFEEIYGQYVNKIAEHMDILITYCCRGSIRYAYPPNPPQIRGISVADALPIGCPPSTMIKIENKGMDIGGKFVVIDYLKSYNKNKNKNVIQHKYILFLHSKSCVNTRKIYYDSLINNLEYVLDKSDDNNNKIGGFFPPTIHRGDDFPIIYNQKYLDDGLLKKFLYWQPTFNKIYLDELMQYFGLLENDITLFPSGNCYFLHIDIANKIFGDKTLYNCLNSKDNLDNLDNTTNSVSCFDYNWVKIYYNIPYDEIEFVYEAYQTFNLKGNYLQLEEKNKSNIESDHIGSDYMFEHIFERIMFQIVINKNMTIDILPNGKNEKQIINLSEKINECYKNRILYKDFNCEKYLKNNNDLAKFNINTKEELWYHWINNGYNERRKI